MYTVAAAQQRAVDIEQIGILRDPRQTPIAMAVRASLFC